MRIVRRPDELRSLVIEGLPESEDVMSAEVRGRLLFPENAPPDAMDPGAEFEVFEGPRLVARGTVGGEAEAVDSARPPP